LKKNTVTTVKVVKNKEERARAREEARLAAQAAAAQQEAVTAVKSVLPEEGLTAAMIQRRIQELAATRRGKDTLKQLRELEGLHRLSIQFGPRTEIPVTMYVIAAQFALQRTLDDCMDISTWKACASYLERISSVLTEEGYALGVENVDASDMIIAKASGNTKMKAVLSAQDGAMAAVAADEKLINPVTQEPETADERAERLRLEKEAAMSAEERKIIPVVGSLSLHLTRLEEEYTKSLQKTSHHSDQYIARLRDETKLVSLLSSFQAYFERVQDTESASLMAQLRIEHLYYRHDSIAKQVDKAGLFYEKYGEIHMLHPACIYDDSAVKVDAKPDFAQFHPGSVCGKPSLMDDVGSEQHLYDFTSIISKLSQYVYKHGSKKSQTRAMICQIYHHALHERFTEARDLLLMSHLQDTIHDCDDVSTMILFNRMMVNIGMCAFRAGRISDAHQCLSDICSGRVRELLAQGINSNRFSDKTPEQEKAEKRRLVPYHQHINLDLLEACHLISAMLLEVPNMAGAAVDASGSDSAANGAYRRHRIVSRTFRKFHDQYHHQVFTGPPEQTRDFVMRASKSLMKGDWKKCIDLIRSMDVWTLIPGSDAATKIGSMLEEKIKIEGLRTFLFAFSAQYDSLSLNQLCGMFSLSKSEVHSVVSKMMINRELLASWDQPTETIVLRKTDLSPLQILALQFAEKTTALVEANERLLDAESGGFGFKDDNWKGDRGDDRGGGRGSGGRGGRGGNYNAGGRDGGYAGSGSGRGRSTTGRGRGRDGGSGRFGGGRGFTGRGRGGTRAAANTSRGSGGNNYNRPRY
jgi:translation initiation factor 3 subunit C